MPLIQLDGSFEEWSIAMSRYIEALRLADRSGTLGYVMQRHQDHVASIHQTTNGASSKHEPFGGKPFWVVYDLHVRSAWFAQSSYPIHIMDGSMVNLIALAKPEQELHSPPERPDTRFAKKARCNRCDKLSGS